MSKPRLGCLPYGLAIAFIITAVVGGGLTLYLAYQANVATNSLTSTTPLALAFEEIPQTVGDAAIQRLTDFEKGTIDRAEFSTTDVNALVRYDQRFERIRNQFLITLQGGDIDALFAISLGAPEGWFASLARVAGKERFLNGHVVLDLPPGSTQAQVKQLELNGRDAPKDNTDWLSMVIAKQRSGEVGDGGHSSQDPLMGLLRYASVVDSKFVLERPVSSRSQKDSSSQSSAMAAPSPG